MSNSNCNNRCNKCSFNCKAGWNPECDGTIRLPLPIDSKEFWEKWNGKMFNVPKESEK